MENLKKEFYFKGNASGCLVIHGFTSTPAEVYEVGQHIHQTGMTVLGIVLKGHATDEADFAKATEQDWIESAVEGFRRLQSTCKTVCVAGHSMGGLLAMYLAEHFPVERLILLAPAVSYRSRITYLAGIARFFVKEYAWPKDDRREEESRYFLGYKKFSMASVHKMTKLQRIARKDMHKISMPTLLVMARQDTLVHIRTARLVSQGIKGALEVLWLEKSGHSVGVECEKEIVFKACTAFLSGKE